MRSVTIIILQVFTIEVFANDSTGKLGHTFFNAGVSSLHDRALKVAFLARRTHLDDVTLGKRGHVESHQRIFPFTSGSQPQFHKTQHVAGATAQVATKVVYHCNWMNGKALDTELGLPYIRNSVARPPHAVSNSVEEPAIQAALVHTESEGMAEEVDNADLLEAAPSDFFEVLGIKLNATERDVKDAYRRLQKISHPDIAGKEATSFGEILNMAYTTLKDDHSRAAHAEQAESTRNELGGSFTGRPVSKWAGPADEQRAIFIDESSCVGCYECVFWAPNTFKLEDTYGRARCVTQWGDDEETLQVALEVCPVNCISWVSRSQLPLLEWAMKGCTREPLHVMALGTGKRGINDSPFLRAERILRYRQKPSMEIENTHNAHPNAEAMAGAIAAAWLELPADVRRAGWPDWSAKNGKDSDEFFQVHHAVDRYELLKLDRLAAAKLR